MSIVVRASAPRVRFTFSVQSGAEANHNHPYLGPLRLRGATRLSGRISAIFGAAAFSRVTGLSGAVRNTGRQTLKFIGALTALRTVLPGIHRASAVCQDVTHGFANVFQSSNSFAGSLPSM